jgi:epoxyqueuosine reductase
VFGCDICQEVCPHNGAAPQSSDPRWQPRPPLRQATLERLWRLSDTALEQAIEGTALRRAGVRGMRRNLAVAIGNAGPALRPLLGGSAGTVAPSATEKGPGPFSPSRRSMDDAVVVEHIEWALRQSP